MAATAMTNKEHSLKISQEPGWTTYIPNPLFLLLVIENGWKVARAELAPSQDQLGLVYLVSLKSDFDGSVQEMILPTNALVKKILAEHSHVAVPVEAGALI
jgi:hypothetical protein